MSIITELLESIEKLQMQLLASIEEQIKPLLNMDTEIYKELKRDATSM